MKLKLVLKWAAVALLQATLVAHAGDEKWVGPGDKPGEGTRSRPYSFTHAFSSSTGTAARIKPGSTVYLMSGNYKPTWQNTVEKTRTSTPKVFHCDLNQKNENYEN